MTMPMSATPGTSFSFIACESEIMKPSGRAMPLCRRVREVYNPRDPAPVRLPVGEHISRGMVSDSKDKSGRGVSVAIHRSLWSNLAVVRTIMSTSYRADGENPALVSVRVSKSNHCPR